MAKKIDVTKAIGKKVQVTPATLFVEAVLPSNLEQRVVELEGDMIRLVKAIGALMGGPFETLGREIISRKQGASKV